MSGAGGVPGGDAASQVLKFAEACFRFTPKISVREGEAVFLEVDVPVGGVASAAAPGYFFSQPPAVFSRVRALAQRFGLVPKLALASQPGEALALARFGVRSPGELPVEALMDYASPFRADLDLFKKLEKIIVVLRMLGVRRLEEFSALPRSALVSHLGEESLRIFRWVLEEERLLWPPFQLPERVLEKVDLSFDPCESMEPLFFILRAPVDRAMARLRGRCLRASRMVLRARLEYPKGAHRQWEFSLSVPQGSEAGILPLLRERMSFDLQRNGLSAPVTEIEFEVLETVPGRGSQSNFFHKQEEEAEAMDGLLLRLFEKLGKKCAFGAEVAERFLPEMAWKPVRPDEVGAELLESSRFPERPARLLKAPELLRKKGSWLTHAQDPRRRWKVIHWDGPERISGEWWWDPRFQGFTRDYYRIIAETGEQLWIYVPVSLLSFKEVEEVFLHGYFD